LTLGELGSVLAAVWAGTSLVEAAAVVLGVVYVVLVILQHRACWLFALGSTLLYLEVFYRSGLYMQAALQVFYVGVALYGLRAWRTAAGAPLPVTRASLRLQAAGLAGIAVVTLVSARWLARETASPDPYLDSLTTWASVFATWMVARKKLENWLWWLVVDALIVMLCWHQKLYASMVLYVQYLGLVIIGWRSWKADLQRSVAGSTT
jgi:nicotinamide mononucleotide transporter